MKLLLAAVPAVMTMTFAVGTDAARTPPAHACAARMPVLRAGRGVRVRRHGAAVRHPRYLQGGDHVVMPRTHRLFVKSRGNRYSLRGVRADVRCASVLVARAGPRRRILVLRLSGGVVRMDRRAAAAAVVLT